MQSDFLKLFYCNHIITKTAETVGNKGLLYDWGSRGREFKSRHSDQKIAENGHLAVFCNFFNLFVKKKY